MYRYTIFFVIFTTFLSSCYENTKDKNLEINNYIYIENIDDNLVFLDKLNGKIIFINNNKIVNFIDLNLNNQQIIEINNENIIDNNLTQSFSDIIITGKDYNRYSLKPKNEYFETILRLKIRFFDKQLFYRCYFYIDHPWNIFSVFNLGDEKMEEWVNIQSNISRENRNKYIQEFEAFVGNIVSNNKFKILLLDSNDFVLEEIYPDWIKHISYPYICDYVSYSNFPISFKEYLEIKNWRVELLD